MNKKNLAVIASRLKCVDAVSVEADKWINKYAKLGYNVHLISGKFGEPVDLPNFHLPEMDYKHPEVRGIKRIIFGADLGKDGKKAADILLNNLVKRIKGPLKNYIVKNKIEILSIEDVLSSAKNLPLNMALKQIISELSLPTISRHHYLSWENPYFSRFDNIPKIMKDIPPNLKSIVHITSTASAKSKLMDDKKISSSIIPSTIDIDKLQKTDDFNKDFRKALGIGKDQLIFLQPTRVKRNKCVEKSIKLVAELNDIMKKDNVLVITGSPVYSRGNYFEEIIRKVKKQNVNVIFANDRIFLGRHQNPEQKFYSIHDAYLHADVILYPNTSDAFGNPVIESAAYKKLLVVNKFPNLEEFLGKGFRFVVMDNKLTPEVVSDTYEMLTDAKKCEENAEHNFNVLKQFYSSDALDDTLIPILNEFDKQKSLMSKVTGLLPKKFWKKKEKPKNGEKSKRFKGKKVEQNKNKDKKKEKPKKKDLKNRKGGYKEPQK
ncbi:glycosyltransferase [Candidatus Woesearchaeota archaeon]|nr:glycosyltransferase [Candidatus Woesearchaeota archaeon]